MPTNKHLMPHNATTRERSTRLIEEGLSKESADLYRETFLDEDDRMIGTGVILGGMDGFAAALYASQAHRNEKKSEHRCPAMSPTWSFGRLWDIYRTITPMGRYNVLIPSSDAEQTIAWLVDYIANNIKKIAPKYREKSVRKTK